MRQTRPQPERLRSPRVAHRASPANARPAHPRRSARWPSASFRGFTLIEVLIVVGIIALLVGITFPAYRHMQTSARISTTRMILQSAATAETEYRAVTGEMILHDASAWQGSYAKNASGSTGNGPITDPNADIERFVWAIFSITQAEQILRVQSDYLRDTDNDGFLELVDAWDNPVIYRVAYDGTGTPVLKLNHTPFLVSAGPDGKWGAYNNTTNEPDADAKDNIYSSEVD